MFQLNGILKKDSITEIKLNNGSSIKKRTIYIDIGDDIFPVAVNVDDLNLEIGKIGDEIIIDISVYAWHLGGDKTNESFIENYTPIN